jgi:2-(1,2-epoxy-1,2-dihydrophenyl)acetyl-CoA isomerase
MSEHNLTVVRRALDAWNRDDWEELEKINHPDVVIAAPEGWPEGGEFEGWDAVRRQFERLKEVWSEEHFDGDSIEAIGEERVLVSGHWRGHGGASGLDADFEMWVVYRVLEGRIVRTDFCLSKSAAESALAGRAEA